MPKVPRLDRWFILRQRLHLLAVATGFSVVGITVPGISSAWVQQNTPRSGSPAPVLKLTSRPPDLEAPSPADDGWRPSRSPASPSAPSGPLNPATPEEKPSTDSTKERVVKKEEDWKAEEAQVEPEVPAKAVGSGLAERLESNPIPVRRPKIEAPSSDKNQRSRSLQERIEDYEDQAPAAKDAIAADEYDRPLVEASPTVETPRGTPPAATKLAIPAAALRLREGISQILQYHYRRPEDARERTPWGMLHAILPYGVDTQISTGRQRYNAVAWLGGNNPCRNMKILAVTQDGRLVAREGVGLQGHRAQMLAIFAQVGVPLNYPLTASGRRFTVEDLLRSEMAACKSGEELTFTLIGLSNYLPTDTQWRAADGQSWDFERLLREEISQPVVGAACGGTHRLMGLSYALQQRQREGLPITGQWSRAETYLGEFVEYAWQLQNRDGSFSTSWFEGRADDGDLDRKLQTTGHILEWLVFTLPAEELRDPRVTQAVSFLMNVFQNGRNQELPVGPKGHALRALALYHARMYTSVRPWMGENPPNSTRSARGTATRR